MSEFPISPDVVETAWAAYERTPIDRHDPMEAAICAAFDKLGLREERVSHFVEDDPETESGHFVDGGRARLVSDYYDSVWRSVAKEPAIEINEATGDPIAPGYAENVPCAQGDPRSVRVDSEPSERQMCSRIMVGSGGDSWDPTCELREGHDGMCMSSSAIDQHRLPSATSEGETRG
jgi:hypothetical protein